MMTKVTGSPFLNVREQLFSLHLSVRRELGIIARVAIIFSRRGLDIASFSLAEAGQEESAQIRLRFHGNSSQLDSVCRDLVKLVDVERLAVAEWNESDVSSQFEYGHRALT